MSELHRVSDTGRERVADVIFVHGLGGDPFATWWHDKDQPKNSFPFWLADDCPNIAVHTLAYEASPSQWLGSSMPLVDRATNVLTRLETERVGGRPLYFVCHSLGGLVVKQTLRSALQLREDAWQRIAEATRGIVFLATPHTGARLADYLGALGKVVRLSVSVSELEASAPALRDLNVWYRQNAKGLGIDTLAMFETRNTGGVRVVDEASADAGHGVPRAIDADHLSICKPQSRSDLVYSAVKNFLDKRQPEYRSSPGPNRRVEPALVTEPRRTFRYFVSYSHRSAEDGKLAEDLRAGLTTAGHEVFIDRGMRVGTDWVKEISKRIDWCDFLVVLLSEASIHSEMVLGEVRMAHRKRRQDDRPQVLPIRVRYDGPLDYELDSYLARVQYLRWTGPVDTSHVLGEIIAVSAPDELRQVAEAPAVFRPPPVAKDPGRPQPSEDVRPLLPGGTMKLSDEFYVRRRSDGVVEAAAKRTGQTIAIKAPRQFGKSSLLIRYLAKCAETHERGGEQRKRFALIDFQNFTDQELEDYPTLLHRLAEQLLRGFRVSGSQVPTIDTQAKLSIFIEDQILTQVTPPLTLAFDEVDRVLGRPYQKDFFSMLRLWHNRRAEPFSPWDQVDVPS